MEDATINSFFVVFFILIAIAAGAIVWLWFRSESKFKENRDHILEIKSKLGSIIREVNNINKLDYMIDVDQNKKLAELTSKISSKTV